MKPSHSRLTCRAHNRFSPSTVLWQYFVRPHGSFIHQQQRLSTTTTAQAPPHDIDEHSPITNPQEVKDSSQLDVKGVEEQTKQEESRVQIKKVLVDKGTFYPTKVQASIAKNVQKLYDERKVSLTASEKLLAKAREAFESQEDYDGVVVQPMVNPVPVKESSLPWCLPKEERTMPGVDRLAIEIERFYESAKPDYFEAIARTHLIDQVRNDVRKLLPKYLLEVFGSERTGLGLATSDIDFRLVNPKRENLDPALAKLPPPTHGERAKAMQTLHNLFNKGFSKNRFYLLPRLRYARYPLIALQDRKSGLDIQIVLANDTSLSRNIMAGFMEQYPHLRQLYFVVKTMLDVRGLTDVFRGGIGSYSLFMMIVASLRHSPCPHTTNDAAGDLLNFLAFYQSFDTRTQGISIEPACLFDKNEHPVVTDTVKQKLIKGALKPLPPYMLSLRDPADETNDLGRKAIAIKHIQATFKRIYSDLVRDMTKNERPSLLSTLVGSSYMLHKERREKLSRYGKALSHRRNVDLAAKAKMVKDREIAEAAGETSEDSHEKAEVVKE